MYLSLIILLLKGIVIGIAVSAPVGAVAILCVRRAAVQGLMVALVTGLGAVTADMVFAILAGMFSAYMTPFVAHYGLWMRLIGGAVMVGMGVATWRKSAQNIAPESNRLNHGQAFLSAFVITITNPFTVIGFTAIFAAIFGVKNGHTILGHGVNLLGILLGCLLWWGFLAVIAYGLRRHLQAGRVDWLRHIAGALLLIFGVLAILSGFFPINF